MRFIGITGGVGAGKTEILKYIGHAPLGQVNQRLGPPISMCPSA